MNDAELYLQNKSAQKDPTFAFFVGRRRVRALLLPRISVCSASNFMMKISDMYLFGIECCPVYQGAGTNQSYSKGHSTIRASFGIIG